MLTFARLYAMSTGLEAKPRCQLRKIAVHVAFGKCVSSTSNADVSFLSAPYYGGSTIIMEAFVTNVWPRKRHCVGTARTAATAARNIEKKEYFPCPVLIPMPTRNPQNSCYLPVVYQYSFMNFSSTRRPSTFYRNSRKHADNIHEFSKSAAAATFSAESPSAK